jgi:Thrombospondin type 3 repeat
VSGMGRARMGWVAYGTLGSLWSSAQFADARNVSVQVIQSYVQTGQYGWSPSHVCSVRNAWAAVGIGNGDADCDGVEDNQEPDNDNDSIPDGQDNCPFLSNPVQTDSDGDGLGDTCDGDADQDGLPNASDNCWLVANPNQADGDNDGNGDACDDGDYDGVIDLADNCPGVANWLQLDQDDDGIGDACDTDLDDDGVPNPVDNCPKDYNPDQTDTDGGGWGDVCDPNPDTPFDEYTFFLGQKLALLVWQEKPVPIPIDPCRCPEKLLDPLFRQQVILEELPRGARAWISDAQGKVVRNPVEGHGGIVGLRFRPRGGQQLYLNIALSPELVGGEIEVAGTLIEALAER